MPAHDLQPTDYEHTRVLGFSVTESIWSAFYAAIPNPSAWELLWYSGGSIDVWADPNSVAWAGSSGASGALINGVGGATDPTVNTGSIDRVILNVSGLSAALHMPGGYSSDVSEWKGYLDSAIANIRSKYANVRMILLQPNIGGPGGGSQSTCTTADSNAAGYGVVRCTYTSPYVRSAITAATRANVRGGYGAFATDCADFADWAGHLVSGAQTTHGQAMAAYYAAHL